MTRPRSPGGRARAVDRRLAERYPGSAASLCALTHRSAFELLAATILSAQCTDVRVNQVTPELFRAFPSPEALAAAEQVDVEEIIRSTGFFHSKARNLVGMARTLLVDFGGEVPRRREDLVTLPGVGRKTANVVRSVAFDLPGLPVDTHVGRLARRLGLTTELDPVRIEIELNEMIPAAQRGAFSLRLIMHGRETCRSRRPDCTSCLLVDLCPKVGVS